MSMNPGCSLLMTKRKAVLRLLNNVEVRITYAFAACAASAICHMSRRDACQCAGDVYEQCLTDSLVGGPSQEHPENTQE
eukprot:13774322-Heterocapsa_arctica.AAC.1